MGWNTMNFDDTKSTEIQDDDDEEKRSEKKIRKRKKQLYKTIRDQMEFYFSDSNLMKDKFLSTLLSESEDGYIELETFLRFNKIRALTLSLKELAQALQSSEILEVDDEMKKLRRITPMAERSDFDESTIYVEHLPSNADHDSVKNIFSNYGNVTYVSLPRFKGKNQNKGFAFIEFDSPDAAQRACEHFGASVEDFKNLRKEVKIKSEKRKRSPSPTSKDNEGSGGITSDEPSKRRKISEASTELLLSEAAGTESEKTKKKKKRKRQKKAKEKAEDETVQLRVMTKLEWKRLRNKYLTLQKTNMTKLKESLLLKNQDITDVNAPVEDSSKNSLNGDGSIIKVTRFNKLVNVTDFKTNAEVVATVLYVDTHTSDKEMYVRCPDNANAVRLGQSKFLSAYGTSQILTGDEEAQYLNKIEEDRKMGLSARTRTKRRGREKLIAKAEQAVKLEPTHIHFDD